MTAEEQAAEDERARDAALRSFASIEPAMADAAGVHRVEMPEEPMRITPGDYGDESSAAPQHEVDQEPGVSEAVDYGAAGQRQMDAHLAEQSAGPEPVAPSTEPTAAPTAIHPPPPPPAVQTPYTPASATPDRAAALASPIGEGQFSATPSRAPISAAAFADAPVFGRATDADPVLPGTRGKPPVDPAREAAAGPLPTLDQGLPSEQEIASRRDDPVMSIIHSLQNGLRGAIGQPTRDYNEAGDALAQERRQGIREALQRKGVLRGQEQQQQATSARQAVQDQLAQERLGLQSRSVAAQEAMVPGRIAQTEAATEHTRAQTEAAQLATQFSRATREERQSAESQLSRGYQQAIDATLRGMGATGDRFRAGLTSPLEQQSAEQLEPLMRRLQSAGMRTTGAGGGSGTPHAPLPGGTLAEQYVAHGIAETVPEAEALIQSLGGPEDTHAISRLDRRLDEETPPPPTGSVQANIAAAQGAADEIQQLIARSGRDIPGIGRLDALVPTMALSEEGRRMRALVLNLSDNYLRMVSGAAIPEHEIESFAERLGASDEPIFREQVARIQREIARRQTGSAASPATATHRRPPTQAPSETAQPAPEDMSGMTDDELRAILAEEGAP